MAKSNIGGLFGFLNGSVGSGTYTTSSASIDGRRKQVVRQKVTNVKNPNTVSQIVQRMKLKPAQLFYDAFEKAVAGGIMSHSWEGISYGPKSRLRFQQLAFGGDPKAYVPKGINFVVPGEYQVSEGSLQSLPWRKIVAEGSEGELLLPDTDALSGGVVTALMMENLANYGIQSGDQITYMELFEESGSYSANVSRIIVNIGNSWQGYLPNVKLGINGTSITDSQNACFAFIVSRGTSSSDAKRSTETMMITPNYASLLSAEAFDAAVLSYQTGEIYNSLNSNWYLNQGSSQAFNGTVFTQLLSLPAGEGVDAVEKNFILGRQVQGGQIVYTIFTSDGTTNGTAYALDGNAGATAAAYTYARVANALGAVTVKVAQYSDALVAQMQGNA